MMKEDIYRAIVIWVLKERALKRQSFIEVIRDDALKGLETDLYIDGAFDGDSWRVSLNPIEKDPKDA